MATRNGWVCQVRDCKAVVPHRFATCCFCGTRRGTSQQAAVRRGNHVEVPGGSGGSFPYSPWRQGQGQGQGHDAQRQSRSTAANCPEAARGGQLPSETIPGAKPRRRPRRQASKASPAASSGGAVVPAGVAPPSGVAVLELQLANAKQLADSYPDIAATIPMLESTLAAAKVPPAPKATNVFKAGWIAQQRLSKATAVHNNALAALQKHDEEARLFAEKRLELVKSAESKATRLREYQRRFDEVVASKSSSFPASVGASRPLETFDLLVSSLGETGEQTGNLLQSLKAQLVQQATTFEPVPLEEFELDDGDLMEEDLTATPRGSPSPVAPCIQQVEDVSGKRAREGLQQLVGVLSDEQLAGTGLSREAFAQKMLESEAAEAEGLVKKLRRA